MNEIQEKKTSELSPSEVIKRMQAFQMHPDWQYLTTILRENVEFLDDQIITKQNRERGKESEFLTNEEVDQLRYKRELQIELVQLPQNIISQLTRQDGEETDFDPFPQSAKDINQMYHEERESSKR